MLRKASFWIKLISVAVAIPFLQTIFSERCDASTITKTSIEVYKPTGLSPVSTTLLDNHSQQFYPNSQKISQKSKPNPKPSASNPKPSLPKPDLQPIPATKLLSPPLLPPNRGPQIEPQTKPILPDPRQRPAPIPSFPLNPWNPAF
jgi:hypothetical protein